MDDGGEDHIESFPFEEKLKENVVGRAQGLNKEIPLMEFVENCIRVWEPVGVECLKSFGQHWPIFESRDFHFLLVHEKDPRLSLLANETRSQVMKRSGDQGNDQALKYYQDPRFRKKTSFDLWIKNRYEGYS